MNPLIQSKITILPLFTAVALVCFALLPTARAVSPAPDGGYLGLNTADGTNALLSLTTGTRNTAIGGQALYRDTTGSNNTAVGVNGLFSNTSSANVAVGQGALGSNTLGKDNTASGFQAMSGMNRNA